MNAEKLTKAINRLELFYWDCHRNGGPDVEVLAILQLCEEARDTEEPDEEDRYELVEQPEDDEIVVLKLDVPPQGPPAA